MCRLLSEPDLPRLGHRSDIDLAIAENPGFTCRESDRVVDRGRADDAERGRELVAARKRTWRDGRGALLERDADALGTRTQPVTGDEAFLAREVANQSTDSLYEFGAGLRACLPLWA